MKKKTSLVWSWVVVIVVAAAWFFAGPANKVSEQDQQRILRAHQATKDSWVGYPAGEEHLQNNTVYWVSVSGVDVRYGRTNYLAVLHPARLKLDEDSRPQAGDGRLFQFSRSIERGYHSVTIVDTTNVSLRHLPDHPAPR